MSLSLLSRRDLHPPLSPEEERAQFRPSRVLLCFRAPYGGLFRHVLDLARQLERTGVAVGLAFDGRRCDARVARVLPDLRDTCQLGLLDVPMPRAPGFGDVGALAAVRRFCVAERPDIIHGHGAKGGLLARLVGRRLGIAAVYTPHGGILHFKRGFPGSLYLGAERMLARFTEGYIFESGFAYQTFSERVCPPPGEVRIIHNGLEQGDFTPASALPSFDFVYVGELRDLKGVDVLLRAVHLLTLRGERCRVALYGAGPAQDELQALAHRLGIADRLTWAGPTASGREAMETGACVVFPSRHESLPYVVLEAAAMGKPIIATDVGGVAEIFGTGLHSTLLPPGDPNALASRMSDFLAGRKEFTQPTQSLRDRVATHFGVDTMCERTLELYAAVLQRRAMQTHRTQTA